MINIYLNNLIKAIYNIDVNKCIDDAVNQTEVISILKEQLISSRNENCCEVTQLKSKIADLEAFIISLQKEKDTLSLEIESSRQTINEQYLRNTSLQELLNQSEIDLHDSNEKLSGLQESYTEICNKCADLEINIDKYVSENSTLNRQIETIQCQVKDNENRIECLNDENNRVSAKNKELSSALNKINEEQSILRAEKDTLLQNLNEEKQRNNSLVEEHRQVLESLSLENASLIKQVNLLQSDIDNYQSKIELLENNDVQTQYIDQTQPQLQESCPQNDDIETQNEDEESCQEDNDSLTDTTSAYSIDEVEADKYHQLDEIVDDDDIESMGSGESSILTLPETTEVIVDVSDNCCVDSNINEETQEVILDKINEVDLFEEDIDEDTLPFIFDQGYVPADKLSIPEVYDVRDGRIINSKEFFSQNENELILWRRSLQEEYLMGQARFICPECKQPVKISGHKLARGKVCYFSHFKDSDDCPYKTSVNRTKEEIERLKYSLVQESDRHKRLKEVIASALKGDNSVSKGVENVECEKRINSDIPYLNWRKPDVYAEYNGRKFVFELQLSTTFVSVIVDRDIFYRLNNYNIVWVFNFEDNREYVDLCNLMCKDIYYANKRNVFIFDADAEEKSQEMGELVLKCRWLDENGKWSSDEYVTLDMFKYDEENHKPYIVDADIAYLQKYPEYAERRKQLENSREYLLRALMERNKREEEYKRKIDEERNNLQLQLLKESKSVSLYRHGTKYGYQYEGTTIVPPKYTSAEEFHDNKYAKVGFNRKIGIVRSDGVEVVPVEYKNIKVINEHYGVLMAIYKSVDLWLNNTKFSLVSEFNEKDQEIIVEKEGSKDVYKLRSQKYRYYYTQSYYGDHPICHKSQDGYDDNILFALQEEAEYCFLWVSGKVFVISNNNNIIVNGHIADIKPIGIGQLFVAQDYNTNLWGVIDIHGHVITDFKYDLLIPTNTEYLIVRDGDSKLFGLIDYCGREFFAPKFEKLICLTPEYFAFSDNSRWGICDRFGNTICEAKYTYVRGVESGSIKASKLDYHINKWHLDNYMPTYINEDEKLCLLDDKGRVLYTEQIMDNYVVRKSGDLYSIYSLEGEQLIDYCLLSVRFISNKIAIIETIDDNHGIFSDGKCYYIANCIQIDWVCENIFKFTNKSNMLAIGNDEGPISEYLYSSIKYIDPTHYVASKRYNSWLYYNNTYVYFIINELGEVISTEFESIDDFENGFANAVCKGCKGIIDSNGKMQEKFVASYQEYMLYEKFEKLYFKNSEDEVISNEYISVECLHDLYFAVSSEHNNLRIYSPIHGLSSNAFYSIKHLVDDIFVMGKSSVYCVYKGVEQLIVDSFKTVMLLDNGYIALEKRDMYGYSMRGLWKIAKLDGSYVTDREFNSIIESNDEYFEVTIDNKNGKIDLNGCDIIERSQLNDELILLSSFGRYGLENKDGKVLLSINDNLTDISLLSNSLIKVCKDANYALFDISGKQITDYKYSRIYIDEDGNICATRNNITGRIDVNGNEIIELQHFNGGYICSCFGEYYVLDESKTETIIEKTNSIIALLDEDGVFTLQCKGGIKIANKFKDVTNRIFNSVKSVGHGLYIVSSTVTRKTRNRHTGFGYRGNPYTYYTIDNTTSNKFGIIDNKLRMIIPCRYKDISEFDSDNNLHVYYDNGTNKTHSLTALTQITEKNKELTADMEYRAVVRAFMSIGLIVEIDKITYIVHKKYLYKHVKQFSKQENLTVRYLGKDEDGHPIWQTSCCSQETIEKDNMPEDAPQN